MLPLAAPYFVSQPFENVRATLAASNDWSTVMEVATAVPSTFVFAESPTISLSITCDVSGSPTLSYACNRALFSTTRMFPFAVPSFAVSSYEYMGTLVVLHPHLWRWNVQSFS